MKGFPLHFRLSPIVCLSPEPTTMQCISTYTLAGVDLVGFEPTTSSL